MRMHEKIINAAIVLLLASCASGTVSPGAPAAFAHVELVGLSPSAGSDVREDTELVADIKYRIEGFRPGVDYYIAPLFASTKGAGMTFNMLDRIADAAKVSVPEGQITVRYRIRRELASPQLARPLTVWFYLMERIGAGKTRVVGKTEAIEFRNAA
jgi:hypothetical protein